MATQDPRRTVTVQRTTAGRYAAVNGRGGRLTFGSGGDADFTPVELLLAAIGGCSAVDVDVLTTRRAEPESFEVVVEADKARGADGSFLDNVRMSFRVSFPAGERGDAARELLPDAVARSHDRLCTVSRTVELPTPVAVRID